MTQAKYILEALMQPSEGGSWPTFNIDNIPAPLLAKINAKSILIGRLVGYDFDDNNSILVFDTVVNPQVVASALGADIFNVSVTMAADSGHPEPEYKNYSIAVVLQEDDPEDTYR